MNGGSIVLVGKPNVGKSTLLNALLPKRLAIVSPRPQTTVYNVCGLANMGGRSVLCVDTPGVQAQTRTMTHKAMNRRALAAVEHHDVVLALFKIGSWSDADVRLLKALEDCPRPKIAVLTQMDSCDASSWEAFAKPLQASGQFAAVIPISALKGQHMDVLIGSILCLLPEAPPVSESIDPSAAFLAQEMLREQLMNQLTQEIPYQIGIEIFDLKISEVKWVIHANLVVHKLGHKKILIGQGGERIKTIGMRARMRLAQLLEHGVELRLWVQHKPEKEVLAVEQ